MRGGASGDSEEDLMAPARALEEGGLAIEKLAALEKVAHAALGDAVKELESSESDLKPSPPPAMPPPPARRGVVKQPQNQKKPPPKPPPKPHI